MNLLEHWYVSRFRPVAGGYLFEQWGCDVHFSEAEVTELRAEWRRIWLSPWLWGGWVVGGSLRNWAANCVIFLIGNGNFGSLLCLGICDLLCI